MNSKCKSVKWRISLFLKVGNIFKEATRSVAQHQTTNLVVENDVHGEGQSDEPVEPTKIIIKNKINSVFKKAVQIAADLLKRKQLEDVHSGAVAEKERYKGLHDETNVEDSIAAKEEKKCENFSSKENPQTKRHTSFPACRCCFDVSCR